MCGIVGLLNIDKRAVSRDLLDNMTMSLAHRGPDGSGIEIQGNVGFGHRRLSIIDPAGGRQPMSNEDGKVWVTFNGEIYNFRELTNELKGKGHRFISHSDTETIVHAYEEWGDRCVERFRGMFAFAVADHRTGKLFLARDHFGIKPLFYLKQEGVFAFASEVQALRMVPNIQWSIDLSAVDQYLWLQYIPAPRTAFEQIKKLPPAHRMTVSFDGHSTGPEKYWDLRFEPDYSRSENEWIEALDETIADSVKAHLISDVPFGAFLSGGVDSSLILAYMTRILNRPVKAFSIGFEEPEFNETPFARYAAETWGAEHHVEIVKPDALSILPDLVRCYGDLFGDSSAIPTYYISQLARINLPMVLSGDGADELFAGYWSHGYWLNSFQQDRHLQPSLAHWLKFINYISPEQRRLLWREEYKRFSPAAMETFEEAFAATSSFSLCHKAQFMDIKTYLPYDILTKVDTASMMHGLEVRPPFVDVKVAELAATIPEHRSIAKNLNGQWEKKLLLKKVGEKYYPPSFLNRPKMGFAVPLKKWFAPSGDLHGVLRQRLIGNDSKLKEFFNTTTIQQFVSANATGPLWLLLFLDEWLRQNNCPPPFASNDYALEISNTQIRIRILYDVEGWAWWHRAKQIKSGVSTGIRVDIARMDQPFSHELYDYVVIFDPYLQGKIRHVPSDKIIVGCSCPKYIDMAVEAIQSGKCVAGLVNSQAMFDQTGMHDKFFCCQNGVDNDLFHPSSQPVTELIGCWVGNSGSAGNKGLDIIQEACERTGTEILILDKEANRDQATLYTQEEVRNKFYHKASFYLCASEFEGTPNPALEAMACGLPVISTAVGNMPELIKDGWNGYIVERSVDSFVAAIKKLRESNLATMRENARTSIENGWTWVQQAKKYENMFRELKKKEISIPKQQERSSINPSLVDTKTTHASPSESRPERACTNKSNRRHVHSDTIATCNHFPTNAHFLMNDKCNAKCVFCGGDYFRSKSNKHISLDQFKTMARNLRLEHFRSVCLAGAGDPLLSPELLPIIRYIETQYPNLHISITTNGIALSSNLSREFANSRISSINISINAATRETYCRLMQVDRFDRVVANARDFIEQRRLHGNGKFPILQLSCALSRINIEELPQLVQLAKSLGIGHINTMYCRFYPEVIRDLNIESPELRLANEDSLFFHQELSDRMVSEAIKLATRYGIQVGHEPLFSGEMKQRPCHWPTNELMVGFDGEIYPCGGGEVHFKRKVDNGVYHFGNALTETIEQFWNNPDYRSLRHSCLHGEDGEIPECLECANYMRNDVRAHIMKWHDFDRATGSGQEQTDAPLVSVIVPTYNRLAMLTEAISSIFSQTMQSFEIIVVNDAGTDVASVLEKFTDTGKIRFLLHENNRGLAAARNTGIRAARGKYIAYLDDDDTYYPNHLETLVNFLESNDCRVAYTDAVRAVQQNTGDGYHTVEKKVLYSRDFDYDAILVDNFIPVLCVIHEKECLSMSGMFDESLPRHEDWDLWIRMSRHERFAHLPTVTCEYTYRPDGTGMTSSTLPLFLKTYKAVYRKYEDLVAEKPCVQANRQKSLFNATLRTFQYIGERVEPFLSNSSVTSEMLAEITPCGAGFSQIKSCLTWRKTDSMPDAAAISCLEMALAIDSENHPARIALCERYLKTGRHADALRHMEFLADANPNEPEFTKTRDALKRQIEACATHTGFQEPTTYSMQTCDTPARPVTVSVFSLDAPQEACARIRLLSHFDALNGSIKANWGVISDGVKCTTNLDMIDQADIIVIQRFYPRKGTVPYIEKMLSSGKPVIYEVDDLLLDLPADNHLKSWAGETVDLFPWLLPRVTAITVSTPLLAKEFSVFNPSVHVIPNLADTELFQAVVTKKNGPVIIGFSGTVTHARDLKKIGEALFRVADRYGDKVAFSFMGLSASEFSSLPGFRFLDFERDYASYGKALSSSGIDIALVPLQDNNFNRCKSNIKWLEYSACGIAGVYADLPPYNTSIRHGASGVLVDDDPDKWFQAICLLIDHPELRQRIANQAKTEVLSHHSLKRGSQVLYTLYESMVGENICTKIA